MTADRPEGSVGLVVQVVVLAVLLDMFPGRDACAGGITGPTQCVRSGAGTGQCTLCASVPNCTNQPQLTRPEYDSVRAADALKVVLDGDGAALTPLMSFFVEAVGDRDQDLLDELEALVRARRAALEKR